MKGCLYSLPSPSAIFQPNLFLCRIHWSRALLYFREGAEHGREYLSSAVTSHGQRCCKARNVKGRKFTEVLDALEKLESYSV